MNRNHILSFLCVSIFVFSNRVNAGVLEAGLTVNMSPEVAAIFKDGIKDLKDLLKDGGPALGDQGIRIVGAAGEQIRISFPNADANFGKATDSVAKAARALSNIRAWPIVSIGLAGVITSIVMFARGIEKYIDADEEKQTQKAKLHICASLIGLGISGCVMGNSQAILNFFSE